MGRWIFLNTTCADFTNGADEWDRRTSALSELSPATFEQRIQPPSPTSCLGHPLAAYSEVESYLLEYFIHGIGPNCSLSPINNPYITLITPLSFCHTTLRNALLAVASNQFSLLGDTRFVKETLVYKDRALKGLQQAICTGEIDDGVIATVLMLCFHDISDDCDPSWVTHLHGGLDLLYRVPSNKSGSCSLRRFFEMYFVAHEIMSRTAFQTIKRDGITHSWSDSDDLDEIDTVMGCSRRLMSLIDDVSDLPQPGKLKVSLLGTPSYLKIASSISTLSQTLPRYSEDRADLAQIAEAKRLAALLYLSGRRSPRNDAEVKLPDRLDKRHLTSAIINIISVLPDRATLLWPLYILGHVGLDTEDHRRFVLERLETMQRARNLGSVRRALMAVKRAFQVVDMKHSAGHSWGDSGFGLISLA
ncbi:Zn(II)2Cys6 transcription factor [Aspergillus heteromorphus CBS 117.55]|uniref:Zn(II)2Cys6 transcription factor n=1 Tax=Aspergillus heteromorphus CBS 117.55 TaxID=1448321 RepID=A0A317WLA0_9EURO|nr:Zn(II)2Cys6 transcription factor [Aspergillus heteromorphus CBS 117.55]PWY86785.1 Zn(II)2Cys6 transcription factor [Aspergillus heteromorphus CBS 117.55]